MSFGYQRNVETIKSGLEFSKTNYYKFRVGKTLIRILPPFNSRGTWLKEVQEYYLDCPGVTAKNLISPRGQNDDRDPLYDYGSALYKQGGELNVAKAKKLRSRQRVYVNAIVLSSPNPEDVTDRIVTIPLPVRVAKELRDYDTDEAGGWADITNPETGRNIEVTRVGTTMENTEYRIKPQMQPLNILAFMRSKGVDLAKQELPDLDKMFLPASTDSLQQVLQTLLSSHWLDGRMDEVASPASSISAVPGGGFTPFPLPGTAAVSSGEQGSDGKNAVLELLKQLNLQPAPGMSGSDISAE